MKELQKLLQERASGDELCRAVAKKMKEKDNAFFLRFLRARKFDVYRAYDLIKGWGFLLLN